MPAAVTYWPAAQFEHAEDPFPEYVLMRHKVQVVEAGVSWKRPAAHEVQADAPAAE